MRVELLTSELRRQINTAEWNESELPDDIEAYGIVDNGELVAWYLVQRRQVHVGPFRVKDERQGYLGGLLILDADKRTKGESIYIAATTEDAVTMCRKMNLVEIKGRLFTRE